MTRDTMEACLEALARTDIPTVDITGGAPELNPDFRWLVTKSRSSAGTSWTVATSCVLLLPSQRGLGEFLAENKVEVIASLPYFIAARTDAQRGGGF